MPMADTACILRGDGLESFVSQARTAEALEELLGMPVPVSRQKARLGIGEVAIVATHCAKSGSRPLGASVLADGWSVYFTLIRVG